MKYLCLSLALISLITSCKETSTPASTPTSKTEDKPQQLPPSENVKQTINTEVKTDFELTEDYQPQTLQEPEIDAALELYQTESHKLKL